MKTFVRLIPVAILATSTPLALAEGAINKDVEVKSKTVAFSRATAQTQPGARDLYDRLRSAAYDVCSTREFPKGTEAKMLQSCSVTALDNAVVEINVPAVTAIHFRRGTVEVMASQR